MQIKQFISAVFISVPLLTSAQQQGDNPTLPIRGRQQASVVSQNKQAPVVNKANAPATVKNSEQLNDIALTPPAKVVVTGNELADKSAKSGNKVLTPADAKMALASQPTDKKPTFVTPPKPLMNSPYKCVPMLGDVDYYGKNHKQMLDYTKNYLRNNGGRLARVASPMRGGKYFSIIDKVMDKNKMPRELKYLAVIESALNNGAVSPVGAVGPWQFMEGTARHMGLTVNGNRDERRDWYKSTVGACKYLNYLYDQFGDWLLVIAAYNSGPRPVMNAISRTGKSDYWAIKKYLPQETQNHVLAFVATATLMERMGGYLSSGVPNDFQWESLNYASGKAGAGVAEAAQPVNPLLQKFGEEELKKMALIRIKTIIDLDLLSNYLNLDRRQIGRWNYDYYSFMDNFKPGDTYNLRIPKEKLDEFIEKKDYLERQSAKMNMQ